MNPRPIAVEYASPYKFVITFANGAVKEFDISPYLQYPIYESLKDEAFCSRAMVINGTVVLSDDIDFDPDRLFLESKELIKAEQ